jgi:RNA polymerase sigma-70 factor (ECF subfamily)
MRARFRTLMDTDDRLIADLARDLDGSFDALVVAHQDRLYTIALRMLGDPRDAEEAAQDALVRAYRALASYEAARIRELRLRGWLTTIVLNLCRTRGLRRAGRGAPPISLDADAQPALEPEAPRAEAPPEVAERHAERDRWRARLVALPPVYRAAVVLRHIDGLSYPEAAAALGRPEGTVKAQVHRGIALLRTMLEAEARHELEEMTA